MNIQHNHPFRFQNFIAERRLIYDIGTSPDFASPDSAEAKKQPAQPKEEDVLTQLGNKLKKLPANAPIPANISDTINDVRTAIQQVQNELIEKLEGVRSGQVTKELQKQLGETVRQQLGQVIRELSPAPSTSVARIRQLVEDLNQIAKINYRDGKIRVEQVHLKSAAGRDGYELHYMRDHGYGQARLGPLSVHGGVSAEAGLGQMSIRGPGGMLVEITAGKLPSGDRAGFSVGHGNKGSGVSVVAGSSTDTSGQLGGYANLNARPGDNATLSAAVIHGQRGTDVVISYQGTDHSLEVGQGQEGTTFQAQYSGKVGTVETGVTIPPGVRPVGEGSLASGGRSTTAFTRGEISLPGGGSVGTRITTVGGGKPSTEFNASIPVVGNTNTSKESSSLSATDPARPTATLGIGVAPGEQYTVRLAGTF